MEFAARGAGTSNGRHQRRRIPQHPYKKMARSIPISYRRIAMLIADNDGGWNAHEPRRRSGMNLARKKPLSH
jgi:hypothetical protein